MQTKVTARHMELTPAIEGYAVKKVQKLTRYFDRIQQFEVLIDQVKNGYAVEIIVDVEHHDPFIATDKHEDLYACIDGTVDKAARLLTDHKSKLRDNKHTHAAGNMPNENA